MKIVGMDNVLARLKRYERISMSAVERGMMKAAGQLLNDCNMKAPTVPLDEGTLRRSGSRRVEKKTNKVVGVVGFNTPYAARWHEVKANFKEPSAGTKYIESKLSRFRDDYFRIIAREVKAVS